MNLSYIDNDNYRDENKKLSNTISQVNREKLDITKKITQNSHNFTALQSEYQSSKDENINLQETIQKLNQFIRSQFSISSNLSTQIENIFKSDADNPTAAAKTSISGENLKISSNKHICDGNDTAQSIDLETIQFNLDQHTAEYQRILNHFKSLVDQVTTSQHIITELEKDKSELQQELIEVETTLTTTSASCLELEQMKTELGSLKNQNKSLTNEIADLNKTIQSIEIAKSNLLNDIQHIKLQHEQKIQDQQRNSLRKEQEFMNEIAFLKSNASDNSEIEQLKQQLHIIQQENIHFSNEVTLLKNKSLGSPGRQTDKRQSGHQVDHQSSVILDGSDSTISSSKKSVDLNSLQKIEQLQNEITSMNKDKELLTDENQSILNKYNEQQLVVSELNQQVSTLRMEMEKLVSQIEMNQNKEILKQSKFDDIMRDKDHRIRQLSMQNNEILSKLKHFKQSQSQQHQLEQLLKASLIRLNQTRSPRSQINESNESRAPVINVQTSPAMGLHKSNPILDNLEERLKYAEKQVLALEKDLEKSTVNVDELKTQKRTLLSKLDIFVKNCRTQINSLKTDTFAIDTMVAPFVEPITNFVNEISINFVSKKVHNNLQTLMNNQTNMIKTQHKEINDKNEQITLLQARNTKLNERIKKLEIEINEFDILVAEGRVLQKELVQLRKSMSEKNSENDAKYVAKMEQLKQENENLNNKIAGHAKSIQILQERLTQSEIQKQFLIDRQQSLLDYSMGNTNTNGDANMNRDMSQLLQFDNTRIQEQVYALPIMSSNLNDSALKLQKEPISTMKQTTSNNSYNSLTNKNASNLSILPSSFQNILKQTFHNSPTTQAVDNNMTVIEQEDVKRIVEHKVDNSTIQDKSDKSELAALKHAQTQLLNLEQDFLQVCFKEFG